MTAANRDDVASRSDELATLCVNHLQHEETLLAAALPILNAVKDAFSLRSIDTFAAALGRQQEFVPLLADLNRQRLAFREALSRLLPRPQQPITLALVLQQLPDSARASIAAGAARVRRLAEELAALNHWIAVHLRIHLEAYRRMLRDVTNSSAGSGRYGPAAKPKTLSIAP